jgi:hypothetical protein
MRYIDRIYNERGLTTDRMLSISRPFLTARSRQTPWTYAGHHGVDLLQTDEQMDAYLASYGEMHQRKIKEALRTFPFNELPSEFDIVDWGCGQGIATMTLLDALRERNMLDRVRTIFLIEPSAPAITRAQANIWTACFGHDLEVDAIQKYLPSDKDNPQAIDESRLKSTSEATIHLFSNILDIAAISLKKTASLLLASGRKHFVICAGPINDNSSRIDEFCGLVGATSYFSRTDKPSFGYTEQRKKFGCKTRGFIIENPSSCIEDVPLKQYADDGDYDDYDERSLLHFLSDEEKIAVMIVGYQLLVSAKQRPLDPGDDPSIDIIYKYCGFDGSPFAKTIGDIFWNHSIVNNPNEAFITVMNFEQDKKNVVSDMLKKLCEEDNSFLREDIYRQLVRILEL